MRDMNEEGSGQSSPVGDDVRIIYVERDRDQMPRWVLKLLIVLVIAGYMGFMIFKADRDATANARESVCRDFGDTAFAPNYCDD